VIHRVYHHEGEAGASGRGVVRVAALGDVHCKQTSEGALQGLFSQVAESADVLLLCGDLTDYGLPEEAHILASELKPVVKKIPILAVLGNHDYESGKQGEVRQILSDAGVIMLDGNSCEISGIGFTGVKGFAGGFEERSLQAWGEESIKRFVHEAADEALKLESGLAKLETAERIVLLHYSPIRATVAGESLEILPFLGSSRLEEPLNRYPVSAVFHGHAHHGHPEGRTRGGVPVFNVAMPLLKHAFPDHPPFRVLAVKAGPTG
jgi:Predicted phosphoesterases, related to the Icc protein